MAHKGKVAHQPLHSSIRVNWEFSSNCVPDLDTNPSIVQDLVDKILCHINLAVFDYSQIVARSWWTLGQI